MGLSSFLNQEWEITESDESVRRVSERLVDGAETAIKGYQAYDAAVERRQRLRRQVMRENLNEALVVTTIVGAIAKFATGRRG